jgi:chorismate mutase
MARATNGLVEDGHRFIAELDEAIIHLVLRRTDMCAELAAVRRAAGGPATELARENEVLRRYREGLGRHGTSLAMLLIELGRGTRPHPERVPLPGPRQEPRATVEHR